MNTIMHELREHRRRRGIRLIDLQEAVGYHRTAIGNWERGKYSPTLVALNDLCQAIGLKLTVQVDEAPPAPWSPSHEPG